MSLVFGTDAWAEALCSEINASSEYRNAAAKWGDGFNGNVLLVFQADPASSQSRSLFLSLAKGACGGARFIEEGAQKDAGFALRAPFSVWRDILSGKTLAATAILTGKMKIDGETMTLLKHAGAHRALITCVAALDTTFPG